VWEWEWVMDEPQSNAWTRPACLPSKLELAPSCESVKRGCGQQQSSWGCTMESRALLYVDIVVFSSRRGKGQAASSFVVVSRKRVG